MNLGSFIPPIPTSKTNLYAITKEITHSIKVTKYIVGFLNFISSVFLAIVNKSIILYFEITKELNIITSINITPKYKIVFPIALVDIVKTYPDILKSNSLATSTDSPCDAKSPIINPPNSENTPTINVSNINILEILFFDIPRVI